MKIKFLIVPLVSILMGCNGGSENESPPNDRLPPDPQVSPGEKIKSLELAGSIPKLEREPTLVGIDNDNNGIRDDVDSYIEVNYSAPYQRSAVEQLAKALQHTLVVDITDMNAVKNANRKLTEAVYCIYSRFDGSNGSKQPGQVSQELESITPNTKERLLTYLAFSKALDGTSWSLPEGDTCE